MTAEHGQELAKPDADFANVQNKWIDDLETFVEGGKKFPDSADAMMELAIAEEFGGDEDKALKWYETIAKDFPESPNHKKAAGARLRLSCVGKPIPLQGKLANAAGNFDLAKLKGKVVLIQYWATWCEPCKSDMPLLKELRTKFKDFEVVGVCLDNAKAEMVAFLKEERPALAATLRRRRPGQPLRQRAGHSDPAHHDPGRQAGQGREPQHPRSRAAGRIDKGS